jgi:hypothetical protein
MLVHMQDLFTTTTFSYAELLKIM